MSPAMEFWYPAKGEEIVLSPATKVLLERRANGCFLCRFILEDQEKHGKLTDYPFDFEQKGIFPLRGKCIHVQLEQASVYGDSAPPPTGGGAAKRP